ncbi:MAG: hypothetical protein HY347_10395 [candidate division NC10 bacterium]|nr:hypothetical protein [candidate division NC10 bacterium]
MILPTLTRYFQEYKISALDLERDADLIISTEFDRYVLEHPEFAKQIPDNALVVILPQDNPDLCEENRKMALAKRELGQPLVYVYVEKVAPQMSRLINPRLELLPSTLG